MSGVVGHEEMVSDSTDDGHKEWGGWTDENHRRWELGGAYDGQHIVSALSVARQLYA